MWRELVDEIGRELVAGAVEGAGGRRWGGSWWQEMGRELVAGDGRELVEDMGRELVARDMEETGRKRLAGDC